MEILSEPSISSTFPWVTPSSSASSIAKKVQRATSNQWSSPWLMTMPSGRLVMRSGSSTLSPGTGSVARTPASTE